MLSRIAEALFWVGRYVERADDTARILDVHVLRLIEDPEADEDAACRSLLAVMGQPAPRGSVDVRDVLGRLAYDAADPSAIAGALTAARENARGARETISSELWEGINRTWIGLAEARRAGDRLGPHAFFRWVRERSSVIGGLIDATMSRDDGWHFLVLGRSLERVDMTARLLLTRALTGVGAPPWSALLRSCGAYEAYLRTYRGRGGEESAAEFLLLDPLFPRSLLGSLVTAEAALAALDRPADGGDGRSTADDARRLLGRARTALEFRTVEELLADLPDLMTSVQQQCSAASDAVSRRFFPRRAPRAWATEALS